MHTHTHTHILSFILGNMFLHLEAYWSGRKVFSKQWLSSNVMVEKLSYCRSSNAVIGSHIYTHILLRHECVCIHCKTHTDTHTLAQNHLHSLVYWRKESGIKSKQTQLHIYTALKGQWLFMRIDDFNGRTICVLATIKAVRRQQPNGGENYIFSFHICVPKWWVLIWRLM